MKPSPQGPFLPGTWIFFLQSSWKIKAIDIFFIFLDIFNLFCPFFFDGSLFLG